MGCHEGAILYRASLRLLKPSCQLCWNSKSHGHRFLQYLRRDHFPEQTRFGGQTHSTFRKFRALADHESILRPPNCHVGLPSTWAVISQKFVGADSPRPRPTGSQGLGVWGADEWSKLPQRRMNYSIMLLVLAIAECFTERPRFRQPCCCIVMDKSRLRRERSWP